ncbi:MAG: phosphate/phosphite/phosphonate ABC transporter substrate-binding protein [Casimicrobium sp.]
MKLQCAGALRGAFCGVLMALVGASAMAAPLKLVIHDDSGNEGEAPPPASRFAPLKQTIETAIARPVEILVTRDRLRVRDLMERNQADVFITDGSDLAAKALGTLGYNFIATARPDVQVLFVGKGGPIELLKQLAGKTVAMPPAESLVGKMCLAELRDFLGTQVMARHSREYSAVLWSVENNVEPVGCIASYAKARDSIEAKKLKVVYEGRPVPAKPVVAALSLPSADRAAIAKALSNLDDEGAGKSALRSVGVSSFSEGGETRLRALSSWLKDK